MKFPNLVVKTPFSEALGWALFHSLWEGIIIAAALAAIIISIRSPAPEWKRYMGS